MSQLQSIEYILRDILTNFHLILWQIHHFRGTELRLNIFTKQNTYLTIAVLLEIISENA